MLAHVGRVHRARGYRFPAWARRDEYRRGRHQHGQPRARRERHGGLSRRAHDLRVPFAAPRCCTERVIWLDERTKHLRRPPMHRRSIAVVTAIPFVLAAAVTSADAAIKKIPYPEVK